MRINTKSTGIGISFIVLGVWFYAALSSFEVQKGPGMKRIVLREGIEKTEDEIARALAGKAGFDIEGAYRTGYSSRDVIEHLAKEPHTLQFAFHSGRYYVGRETCPYILPFSVCILCIAVGAGLIVLKAFLN